MNGDSMIESNGGDGRGTGAADGTADGTAAVAERRAQTGEPHALDALRTRLRENGLVLLSCGTGGELNAPGSVGVPGEDWLTDLFCGSPLFRKALRRVAEQWNQEYVPREVEVLPGVWLAGTPVLNRRRRSGYVAAIVPTTPLLEAEQLAAMCQSGTGRFLRSRRRGPSGITWSARTPSSESRGSSNVGIDLLGCVSRVPGEPCSLCPGIAR